MTQMNPKEATMTNEDDLDLFMPQTPEEERADFERMQRNREANAEMKHAELEKFIEDIVHEVKDRTDLEIKEHIERRLRIWRGW